MRVNKDACVVREVMADVRAGISVSEMRGGYSFPVNIGWMICLSVGFEVAEKRWDVQC